ncbi:MAG: hypothetical protein IID53_14470 [Proteobacteria bacterium]|nr:hypothetical protein [Pseudomonadota bacterium]
MAAAAIAAFGFAGTAQADEWADSVDSIFIPAEADVSGDDADGGADALGVADGAAGDNTTYTSLGWEETDTPSGGTLVLDFTDNTCLNGTNPDFTVFEVGAGEGGVDEPYDVSVGLQDGALTSAGSGVGDTDLNSPVAAFNRISITATGDLTGDTSGPDIDAVECLNNFNFGTAHIAKDNLGDGTIEIQAKGNVDNGQQFFSFKITIANPEDEDLSVLVIRDVLPAEFDLDPDAEDTADGGLDGSCPTDGVCDGVMVTINAADCSATGAEHTNNGKSGKPFKRQPDIVTINAGGLGDDESCEITVWAMTDQKANNPKKVTWTPTECNEGTFIFLNEGVEVIHTNGTPDPSDDFTLFVDDDQIKLICTGP